MVLLSGSQDLMHKSYQNDPGLTQKRREDLSRFKMGCLELDRQLVAKNQLLDSQTLHTNALSQRCEQLKTQLQIAEEGFFRL